MLKHALMKRFLFAAAIILTASAANASEIVLLCHSDPGLPYPARMTIKVDLDRSSVTIVAQGNSANQAASVSRDFIEYGAAGYRTRIDRASGDYKVVNPAGRISAHGQCERAHGPVIPTQ